MHDTKVKILNLIYLTIHTILKFFKYDICFSVTNIFYPYVIFTQFYLMTLNDFIPSQLPTVKQNYKTDNNK